MAKKKLSQKYGKPQFGFKFIVGLLLGIIMISFVALFIQCPDGSGGPLFSSPNPFCGIGSIAIIYYTSVLLVAYLLFYAIFIVIKKIVNRIDSSNSER